jgi:hypothetical protein
MCLSVQASWPGDQPTGCAPRNALASSDARSRQVISATVLVVGIVTEVSLAAAFDLATYTAKASKYADVLYACVMVRPDDEGYFAPADIRQPFSSIVGKACGIQQYNPHLTSLSQGRGLILHGKGPERARRYRFSDPLMEPRVLLKVIMTERIDPKRMIRSDEPRAESERQS